MGAPGCLLDPEAHSVLAARNAEAVFAAWCGPDQWTLEDLEQQVIETCRKHVDVIAWLADVHDEQVLSGVRQWVADAFLARWLDLNRSARVIH